MFVIEEFFFFNSAHEGHGPFLNGYHGVLFQSHKLLDSLCKFLESITFPKDTLLGEGFWISDVGRRGKQLVPVLRWATDISPAVDHSNLWTAGRAAACLGIFTVARVLERGLV